MAVRRVSYVRARQQLPEAGRRRLVKKNARARRVADMSRKIDVEAEMRKPSPTDVFVPQVGLACDELSHERDALGVISNVERDAA
jgi:hypothetical protein